MILSKSYISAVLRSMMSSLASDHEDVLVQASSRHIPVPHQILVFALLRHYLERKMCGVFSSCCGTDNDNTGSSLRLEHAPNLPARLHWCLYSQCRQSSATGWRVPCPQVNDQLRRLKIRRAESASLVLQIKVADYSKRLVSRLDFNPRGIQLLNTRKANTLLRTEPRLRYFTNASDQ